MKLPKNTNHNYCYFCGAKSIGESGTVSSWSSIYGCGCEITADFSLSDKDVRIEKKCKFDLREEKLKRIIK